MTTPWLGDGRAAWLAAVEVWVTRVAADHQHPVLAIESVHERPWGAVLRVVTTGRPLYFKAAGPLGRHEPRIIADLSARWPTLAPDLVAVDHERAWMVLCDHGAPMAEVLDPVAQVASLEGLLPAYAEMQQTTSGLVPEWLATGTPDRRVGRLPELVDALLRGDSPIGPLRITDRERSAYLADLRRLTDVCAELAATPCPAALDHADLHGTNVLVDGPHRRVADWGDSCITHPFSSLFVPYELVVTSLPDSKRRGATLRLRDAYLASWGSTRDHRRAFGLAVWVAHAARAISVAHATLGEPNDHSEIAGLLRTWHAKRSLLDRPDDVVQP